MSIIVVICAVIIEIMLAKKYLKILENKKIIQPLLEEGPQHQAKSGTPTMGAISFIITIVGLNLIISTILLIKGQSIITNIILLIILIGYSIIGYKDDILKVLKKKNDSGLSAKQKLIFQFLLAAIVFIILLVLNFDFSINLFIANLEISSSNELLQAVIYFIFIIFLISGISNATNLTDGLDGLLSTTYIIALIPIVIIAYLQKNIQVVLFALVTMGALIGFLRYNFNPAKMFMGDTGSLALGALLAGFVIILKIEILIIPLAFVYIFETLSVVIQVGYFKYTKKKTGNGKRFFLMAPYHHHLEKKNMSEKKIVLTFALIQTVCSVITLIIYIK